MVLNVVFFFSSRRRHTRCSRDWSSDVCSSDLYTSKHGYPVTVDVQADQVRAVEFDAIVVPGGYAPDMMRRHAPMVGLVREAAQQGKVVAAICHAGWMLVSAGILHGREATTCFSAK